MARTIDATGRSIDEAIFNGLKELEISIDEVEIDIIQQESKGILGIGAKPAIVRLTEREPEDVVLPEYLNPKTSAASVASAAKSVTAVTVATAASAPKAPKAPMMQPKPLRKAPRVRLRKPAKNVPAVSAESAVTAAARASVSAATAGSPRSLPGALPRKPLRACLPQSSSRDC